MKSIVITGTDTDVGKTHVSCQLILELANRGHRVGAYKPAVSGIRRDGSDDPDQLFAALHENVRAIRSLSDVAPQSFAAPLAPPIAAELEGRKVDEALLVDGAWRWQPHCDLLIIEGAGGALAPISDQSNILDLALRLDAVAVLVAANRLGVLNHTLLSVEAIETRGLKLAAIHVNDREPQNNPALKRTNIDFLTRTLPKQSLTTTAIELADCLEQMIFPSIVEKNETSR